MHYLFLEFKRKFGSSSESRSRVRIQAKECWFGREVVIAGNSQQETIPDLILNSYMEEIWRNNFTVLETTRYLIPIIVGRFLEIKKSLFYAFCLESSSVLISSKKMITMQGRCFQVVLIFSFLIYVSLLCGSQCHVQGVHVNTVIQNRAQCTHKHCDIDVQWSWKSDHQSLKRPKSERMSLISVQ